MRRLINILLFMAQAVVVCTMGFDIRTWQYWAVLACTAAVETNAVLGER